MKNQGNFFNENHKSLKITLLSSRHAPMHLCVNLAPIAQAHCTGIGGPAQALGTAAFLSFEIQI